MTEPRDFGPQDELTTGERRAFAALPREVALPADLEERAVALMRKPSPGHPVAISPPGVKRSAKTAAGPSR